MTERWRIAQMNVASALYPLEDSRMVRFVEQLDETNALAEASEGFIWRLQSASGNATDIKIADDPTLIINMSVWRNVESLFEYAYKSAHRRVVADRRKWFKQPGGAFQVLWWVPKGHTPTVDEGLNKLELLREKGPTCEAFDFKVKFPSPNKDENLWS